MRLGELLRDIAIESLDGDPELAIAEVRDDSRLVGAGDLFVALPGLTVDGHDFVRQAAARGAAAVVTERPVEFPGAVARVASAARALGGIAANRHGRACEALKLVGVTGTNGKTTTTYLIESILRAGGARPGVVGTVSYRPGGAARPAPMTTPSALALHALFAEMRDARCDHAVLEVSSHALAQGRVAGLRFRAAVFTNLTQDHLDFHGTMERYFHAKARLFSEHLAGDAIVAIDAPGGARMAALAEAAGRGRVLRCAVRGDADLRATSFRSTIEGLEAAVTTPIGPIAIRSPLVGDYNLANVLCAVGVGVALGLSASAMERGVASLGGVPGRLERVPNARGVHVFVDYAHTPDALERATAALRPLTAGRLIVVFGCGGDRDRGKRPLMGEAVARYADVAVVTSDNPRTEEPQVIVDEILVGVRRAGPRELHVVLDRREAIRQASALARPGDTLLIAGKGHEDYQIVGKTKLPFDDREETRAAFEALA
ncbi:MAG: UDP-N-acetylmuramoyl-L-alanyl-D-glutamate--2,6-diaminopimelate ligase [Myxococcota bacterium]